MKKSLVLVLGAGASKEVGLPIGTELKSAISKLLNIEHTERNGWNGDPRIADAIRRTGEFESHQRKCWHIRDAMPLAISIDNFLDSHADDPEVVFCGKVAIARAILAAESRSGLAIDRGNMYNKLDFEKNKDTWFNSFFQLLTENCNAQDLPARLRSVGIVTFNYDRCLEHFLFNAIQNYYGLSPQQSAELLTELDVHHPYGTVGSLEWMVLQPSIDFGAEVRTNELINVSQQIRTFTELAKPADSDIESIQTTVRGAERLVFLGFAFHRLNMDLLFEGGSRTRAGQRIFGSAYGISPSDREVVLEELSSRTGQPVHFARLSELSCAATFQEYWRSLSLARR